MRERGDAVGVRAGHHLVRRGDATGGWPGSGGHDPREQAERRHAPLPPAYVRCGGQDRPAHVPCPGSRLVQELADAGGEIRTGHRDRIAYLAARPCLRQPLHALVQHHVRVVEVQVRGNVDIARVRSRAQQDHSAGPISRSHRGLQGRDARGPPVPRTGRSSWCCMRSCCTLSRTRRWCRTSSPRAGSWTRSRVCPA